MCQIWVSTLRKNENILLNPTHRDKVTMISRTKRRMKLLKNTLIYLNINHFPILVIANINYFPYEISHFYFDSIFMLVPNVNSIITSLRIKEFRLSIYLNYKFNLIKDHILRQIFLSTSLISPFAQLLHNIVHSL